MAQIEWKQRMTELEKALVKLEEVDQLIQWSRLSSLTTLRRDVHSLSDFFHFLLKTERTVDNPDLGYFSVLPIELILAILKQLDAKSLCRASRTCVQLKVLAQDEAIWENICRVNFKKHIPYKPQHKSWNWMCKALMREWKDSDYKEGPGTYTLPTDGSSFPEGTYWGDWLSDKRNGWGTTYWFPEGSLYTGEWKDDKRHGRGTRIWPNRNKYTGDYLHHKRHGKGEFTFSNGSIFIGTFEDNKFIQGMYTWPNGRVYDGEWDNIFRHGKGSYTWPDGRTYIGDWLRDKRHGNGTYQWADGDKYIGTFVDGRRVGKGMLIRANGEIYDQEWKEEKFEEFNKGIPDDNENSTERKTPPYSCTKRKMDNSTCEKETADDESPRRHKKPRYS